MLNALAPGMVIAFLYMMGVAFYMGWKERRKLGITTLTDAQIEQMMAPASGRDQAEAASCSGSTSS